MPWVYSPVPLPTKVLIKTRSEIVKPLQTPKVNYHVVSFFEKTSSYHILGQRATHPDSVCSFFFCSIRVTILNIMICAFLSLFTVVIVHAATNQPRRFGQQLPPVKDPNWVTNAKLPMSGAAGAHWEVRVYISQFLLSNWTKEFYGIDEAHI